MPKNQLKKAISVTSLAVLVMSIFVGIQPVEIALAATIEVDTLTDENDSSCGDGDCSLRDAIETAVAGDTITFNAALNGGTITLSLGHIVIDKNLTITGPGANQLTISGNNSSRIFNITDGTVIIAGVTITKGNATGGGGIRYASANTLTLTQVTFSNNEAGADGGGAVYQRTGHIIVDQCTFTNNSTTRNGGAMANNADAGAQSIQVDKSTFKENTADNNGGAIANQVDLTITNSTFSKNEADSQGGAIFDAHFGFDFSTHITNSTFSGNKAKEDGGAIFYLSDGDFSLNNVTITGNTADNDDNGSGDGGGFYEEHIDTGYIATFQNTILSGNTDEGGEMPNCGGDAAGDHLNSQDYNLVQDTTGCNIGGTTTNNITGQDANLAALANNGGETETHALNDGSPAIDAGNDINGCADHDKNILTTDQRGETRPINGRCDIGAYEASVVTTGNFVGETSNCGGPCSVGSAGKYCTFCPDVTIRVPANTVKDGSRVIVNEITGSGSGGNLQLGNSIFDIKVYGPDGQLVTTFDPPLEVCIKPTNATLSAAGWNFDNLTMFHSHAGGAWNALLNTFESNGKLCASVWQLSLFTITTLEMPATGFAPGTMTTLPTQPEDKSYSILDNLTLEIPDLNLSMPIVGVPLDLNGWDVSWLGDRAGYLEGTAFPTWEGNTAITAHVWNADNTPGPFINLHTLQHGDQIIIQAWDLAYTYEVVDVQQVNPSNLEAIPQEDFDILTLFTCQGFNESNNQYNWRLAVRAVLVEVAK